MFSLQIFPLHIKGIGGSLAVLVNWTGAWAVSYAFNFLMSWSQTGTKQTPQIMRLLLLSLT